MHLQGRQSQAKRDAQNCHSPIWQPYTTGDRIQANGNLVQDIEQTLSSHGPSKYEIFQTSVPSGTNGGPEGELIIIKGIIPYSHQLHEIKQEASKS